MKSSAAAIIAAFFAGGAVAVLAKVCPESCEPVLYWSMPVFHQIFPPWTAGPNPKAAGCALIIDSLILTVLLFLVLRTIRTHNGQRRQQ
jgi:hypothetical protein